MSNPLISIQILNWNRAEETVRAIDSALSQSYDNFEVVIVDNGSSDHSISLISEKFPFLQIIKLEKNFGCPGGRNRGIPFCKGEFIFYLDNDGVLHKDALKFAYEAISKNKNIGVVTGKVYDFDTPSEIDSECSIRSYKSYNYNNFQGGICLHRKSMYKKTGVYPDHFMYGGEELFLTYKAIEKGFSIVKNESVVLWHKRSSIARNRKRELVSAYNNKLYVSLVLFPLFYAVSFLFFFVFFYWIYAIKEKFFIAFVISLFSKTPRTIVKGIKDRMPVSYKTYRIIKSIKY